MNRIDQKFKSLKEAKQKAFIAFITAGDPNIDATVKAALDLEKAGADILEIGIPFSDPLADGPTIQASSFRALAKHTNLPKIFEAVKKIRQHSQIPIAFMTYYNPVFHYGEEKFVQMAKACGVDGLIIPDLPPEEAQSLIKVSRKMNLATIFFVALTTTESRIRKIVKASTGFIYFVSLTGVTGARRELPTNLISKIKALKKLTDKPICVGFGVSTPEQVKTLAQVADGVIVGSAIVKAMSHGDRYVPVTNLVKPMAKACHI